MSNLHDWYQSDADEKAAAPVSAPSGAPHFQAQAELLQRAAQGDLQAAAQVLSYLTSSLTDLRWILNQALHEGRDPQIWRCLLTYLAERKWGSWNDPTHLAVKLDWKEPHAGAVMQTISAVYSLDETPAEAAIKHAVLLEGLQSSPAICRPAACLLGLRGAPVAIPVLEEMIAGGEAAPSGTGRLEAGLPQALEWQIFATHALAALGDPRCAPPLIRALANGRGALHRAAGRALHDLGRAAQPALLEALHHPDSHVRWHAARALAHCADASGAAILCEGLYDEQAEVRWATANVLADLDAAVLPAILRSMIGHRLNESYRRAIYHALHSMSSHHTQELVHPVLEALHGPAPSLEAPLAAERLLERLNL